MSDFLYRILGGRWLDLTGGDFVWAAICGVVAGGLAAGGYAWFAAWRKNRRAARMRAVPCRYLRLPLPR